MKPTKKEILEASSINIGEKEKVPAFKRKLYAEVLKILEKTKLNISITGLRRVGKTTLIKQVLNRWPNPAFYFSFDEYRYQNYETLKHVIEVFIKEADYPLIALDEVGKIKGWAGLIKKYYDQGKARFIVSGSSSLSVSKGGESLAGRIFELNLPPLQYYEFIQMVFNDTPIKDFSEIFKRETKNRLEEFFTHGSFPEISQMEPKFATRYVKESVVSKIIFEDIPDVFQIEYRNKLYEIFTYMADYSGNLLYENALAELLGISKTTVSEYIFYLELSFLAYLIYTAGSLAKRLKKIKKSFVATPVLYKAFTTSFNVGALAEVAVFDRIIAEAGEKPAFYRDAQKREVDFIVEKIPIEVKFKRGITKEDLRWLIYYLNKKKLDTGIVITRDILDEREMEGKKITFIPLHTFLAIQSFENFPS